MPKEVKAKAATKARKSKTEGAKGEKKKRAPKDKNAPKRAMPAYLIYSNEVREQVKKENPKASFGELGKLIGEQWKSMSEKQKKPYEEKSKKDKERYAKEMSTYESGGGAPSKKPAAKASKKKEEEEEEEDEEEEEEEEEEDE
mmetsp:Transcript_2046/g.3842  ORF Transcript_2046/g.3842 Transcript_2046/m.3842 type:complete len:143 (-) Transcript_2046:814-1242(-)|eukprot:CAMPEP_0196667554 /NCGR_PEP_ID=MMETSP1086-20130531/65147_1 /TAXON_ID=77921 /ORGANISM="Cyanoptyche  gloeocystis , Strain SAG4.97" /LENGTH=142 /DNA_ID=CAMNT_0042004895 /DNA_START=101 /DNA_END=529 /DNA_ORIENTATION=+